MNDDEWHHLKLETNKNNYHNTYWWKKNLMALKGEMIAAHNEVARMIIKHHAKVYIPPKFVEESPQ